MTNKCSDTEIIVGILSYNEADNIAFVTSQYALGAKVYKPIAPKFGLMFTQVITTLSTHISIFKNEWLNGKSQTVHGQLDYEDPQASPLTTRTLERKVLDFSKKGVLRSSIMHLTHYQATSKYIFRGDGISVQNYG